MPRTAHRLALAATAALALSVGCRHDPAPERLDLPESAPPPPPPELSKFSAPLAYDFGAVLRIVDRAVPTKFGSIDSIRAVTGDSRRHYAFAAERSPFTAYAEGNLIHLRATVSYSARGFYKPPIGPTVSGSCGTGKPDDRPRVLIELATPLTLTDDWHLESAASIVTVEPASTDKRDRCDVTFLHRDVTNQVVAAARTGLSEHLADIDRKVSDVDLRDRFAALWELLEKPIRVSDNVWLVLDPKRLAIGGVTGRAHVLTIPVTLDARPAIVTSSDAPQISRAALPPLGHDGSASGFHILLDGQIDYVTASDIVDRALAGRVIAQGGKSVHVTGATLGPGDKGRLILAVSFEGDARGTLRFTGTPTFDPEHNEIALPDLDYALTTDNALLATYAWLRSDAMRAGFRDRAHLPVDSALAQGRAWLMSGLNRRIGEMTNLNASVKSVAVRGLYLTRNGIVVRAEATGSAGVAVRPK